MTSRALIAGALAVVLLAAAIVLATRARPENVQCGPGFVASGPRCLAPDGDCPAPLARGARGCDAPAAKIDVPPRTLAIGPSDWEAEGRVAPRMVNVAPFAIDAFEVTIGAFDPAAKRDLARAASGVAYDEAERFCASRGGRLPTDDEWLAAASADAGLRRYPWGDTGAVCRRAAWGLDNGPCATGATGPDTVGAHPEGDTPLGMHDLAGNVAEWVNAGDGNAAVRGGSWASALATDLRTWARVDVPRNVHDAHIGFRCAYDVTPRPASP
jgi:formylglycine-generating enzyme required for sulfatase activity